MADLTVTPGSVLAGSDATIKYGTSGATVTAGQAIYKDSSDGKIKLADADSATEEVRQALGIALNGASNGQPIAYMTGGSITAGASLTAGTAYYLSPTPGGIAPLADVLSGDYVVLLGLATSTTVLKLDVQYSGVSL